MSIAPRAVWAAKVLETYLPVYRARKRWSDRVRQTGCSSLFPGYLFCRFGLREKLRVLQSPGVRSIVGAGKQPAPVEEDEDFRGAPAVLSSGGAVGSLAVPAHWAECDHRARTSSSIARSDPADQELLAGGGQRGGSGLLGVGGIGRRSVVAGSQRPQAWEPRDESSVKNPRPRRCGAWSREFPSGKWPAPCK